MKTKGRNDYNFNFLSFDRRCSTKCTARNQTRFQFLRLLVPCSYFSLPLVTKSLVDLLLVLGIIRSPIFIDLFPVVFTVLASVISDVFLVLLTMGSLAADESFLVNFIPSFTSGFENFSVLSTILFLPSQDSLFVLCIISFIVNLVVGNLLVILRYMTRATRLTNND